MNPTDAAPALLTPSRDAARTELPPPRRLRTGLEAWLHGFAGRRARRAAVLDAWMARAADAAARRKELRRWSDADLDAELGRLRLAFRRRVPEGRARPLGAPAGSASEGAAFAALAEAAHRTLGIDPHPNQLAAAVGLQRGSLVELATGEGKTLVLGLAAVLAGWTGRPCHIVTANDYLAARDRRTLGPLYQRCGLTVGTVLADTPPHERRAGHGADVTYTTAKELLADFLRDRLQLGPWTSGARRLVRALREPSTTAYRGLVLRGLDTVLVDEADHVLIDEAVTPLIISRPRRDRLMMDACAQAMELAEGLRAGSDYDVDLAARAIDLRAATLRRIREEWQPAARVFRNARWRVEMVRQALQAREFFQRDRQYVIRGGKVVIVDEGTGRPQPHRSWRQGLHQLIEAKERLALSEPTETLASVSFQKFFRTVPRLAGVSGTAAENAAEFWRVYQLPVVAVPSHAPCIRQLGELKVVASAADRWRDVAVAIAAMHRNGRPILVGTRNVAASEHLAALLRAEGIACAVLNARQLDHEAEVITHAGEHGRVTIATNLAGRGTDIRLDDATRGLGGLAVFATELHAAARIDRQLHGRAGRQGDPGTVHRWASLDDEFAHRFLPGPVRRVLRAAVTRKLAGAEPVTRMAIRFSQWRAERHALQQRLDVLRRDAWLKENLGE